MGVPRGPQPVAIALTERQRAILEQIVRRATSPQRLVTRSKIILKAACGKRNQQIADELELKVRTPRLWRGRWATASAQLTAHESELSDAQLREQIESLLTDQPRSGTPPTFTAEHICQIVALACESPQLSGRPVTEWTPGELAAEARQRGIVPTISPRSVGRFLKGRGFEATSQSLLVEQ
jgi:transposase